MTSANQSGSISTKAAISIKACRISLNFVASPVKHLGRKIAHLEHRSDFSAERFIDRLELLRRLGFIHTLYQVVKLSGVPNAR
jgi:hypothetical protein